MKSKRLGVKGFTLVEIMIVVALIGLLAVIAIPNWVHAREQAQKNSCINNLRQVNGAVQQWALETKQPPGATVTVPDIIPYLKSVVTCPAGGVTATLDSSYELHGVTSNPTCKISTDHWLPADTSE